MPDYLKPAPVISRGLAPSLSYKLLHKGSDPRTYVLAFGKGDEVISELTQFAEEHNLWAAHFEGIGAFQSARIAWFDRNRKEYRAIPVPDSTEVLSIIGNIARHQEKVLVHVHCTLGREDGTTVGGHLWEATVFPTLEIYLTEEPGEVIKEHDSETGLELMKLDDSSEEPEADSLTRSPQQENL